MIIELVHEEIIYYCIDYKQYSGAVLFMIVFRLSLRYAQLINWIRRVQ